MVPGGPYRPFTVVLIDDRTGRDAVVHVRAKNSELAIAVARSDFGNTAWRASMVFPGHHSPINGETR
jgi:hypothetical protein